MYSSLSDSDAAIDRAQRSLDTIEARTAALAAHIQNHADDTARAMFLLENLADTALTDTALAVEEKTHGVDPGALPVKTPVKPSPVPCELPVFSIVSGT